MRVGRLLPLVAVIALAGCGSSGGGISTPTVAPAQTFKLSGFTPDGPVTPGKLTRVSFTIDQPSGKPLTQFKTGPGPHTGVHLIIVRDDLGAIIHRHPPIAPDGTISDRVRFPSGGHWHALIDVYPNIPDDPQTNFQLTKPINVKGAYKPVPIGSFHPSDQIGSYKVTIHDPPKLKALYPAFLNVSVTGPHGVKEPFTAWYGALAHAIFFQKGTLNYFHTHVCAAGISGCTSVLGGAKVTGQSTTPGKLSVGVLLPLPGTWKLFLQTKVHGDIITAPFTIKAS